MDISAFRGPGGGLGSGPAPVFLLQKQVLTFVSPDRSTRVRWRGRAARCWCGGRDAIARVSPMDYRDELRLGRHQPLSQEADSLPQPCTVAPIFRYETQKPGSIAPSHNFPSVGKAARLFDAQASVEKMDPGFRREGDELFASSRGPLPISSKVLRMSVCF